MPADSRLRVAVVQPDGEGPVVVHLQGELDLTGRELLAEVLLEACRDPRDVVLDMSGLTFMDSTGLSQMVAGARRLRSRGCSLQVVGAGPQVRSVFRITGLLDELRVSS